MNKRVNYVLLLTMSAGLAGCWNDPEPRPLGADQFLNPDRPKDQPGVLVPGRQPAAPDEAPPTNTGGIGRKTATPGRATPTATPSGLASPGRPSTPASAGDVEMVNKQIKSPKQLPSEDQPGRGNNVDDKGGSASVYQLGQYMTIGGVIAQVNREPIYADDVLRSISRLLAGRAKDLKEDQFRSLAESEINRQTDDMIRAAVEYAAAERNTTEEDRSTAERMTEAWRERVLTANKGSLEEARKMFKEQGADFEEVMKDQYRVNLVRVYQMKKIIPRIQVSAEDMRRYYQQNKETEFTDRPAATFRMIAVSAKDMGSVDAAQKQANELQARAVNGESFEELAGAFNQDAALKKDAGLIGPIDRNAFKFEKVEDAVWEREVGQTTPVIRVDDTFYIAQPVSKKLGRVASFDEESVQKKLNDRLRGEQFSKLRSQGDKQLRSESVVMKNPEMIRTAVDMAMQNYDRWHAQ